MVTQQHTFFIESRVTIYGTFYSKWTLMITNKSNQANTCMVPCLEGKHFEGCVCWQENCMFSKQMLFIGIVQFCALKIRGYYYAIKTIVYIYFNTYRMSVYFLYNTCIYMPFTNSVWGEEGNKFLSWRKKNFVIVDFVTTIFAKSRPRKKSNG